MKSYDWAKLINGLYEQLVHNNQAFSRKEGIYFRCKLECEFNGYEKDGTHHPEWEGAEAKDFHIIILNPHKVFTCITDSSGICSIIPPAELWYNNSNHDSCWRDVSGKKLTHLMLKVHDKAFENCPKKYRPQIRSQDVRFSLEISLFGDKFKFVEVEYESIPDNCYHYKLTSIKKIKKTIEIG